MWEGEGRGGSTRSTQQSGLRHGLAFRKGNLFGFSEYSDI